MYFIYLKKLSVIETLILNMNIYSYSFETAVKAKEEFMDSGIQVNLVGKQSFLETNSSKTVFIKGNLQNVSDKALYEAYRTFGNIKLCEVR